MAPLQKIKKRIGEILVDRGLITQRQLEEVLAIQQEKGKNKRVGQILVELGYVTNEEISLVEALHQGCPYIKIDRCEIDAQVADLLPEALMRRHLVVPVDKIKDVLTVAMVDPFDQAAIEQVQRLTKCNVKVFTTTTSECKEAIEKFFIKK